jgi:hypothetical protein
MTSGRPERWETGIQQRAQCLPSRANFLGCRPNVFRAGARSLRHACADRKQPGASTGLVMERVVAAPPFRTAVRMALSTARASPSRSASLSIRASSLSLITRTIHWTGPCACTRICLPIQLPALLLPPRLPACLLPSGVLGCPPALSCAPPGAPISYACRSVRLLCACVIVAVRSCHSLGRRSEWVHCAWGLPVLRDCAERHCSSCPSRTAIRKLTRRCSLPRFR